MFLEGGTFTPENSMEVPRLWTPEVTIRPHHFKNNPEVRIALKKQPFRKLIEEKNNSRFHKVLNLEDPAGYWQDIVGKSRQEKRSATAGTNLYLEKLSKLRNDSVVRLGLEPDGMCAACPLGRHCTATNYESLHPPRDVVKVEEKILNIIYEDLLTSGFSEGEDFIFQKTTHTFYDYGGQQIGHAEVEPLPIEVDFNSLLALAGPLRAAA